MKRLAVLSALFVFLLIMVAALSGCQASEEHSIYVTIDFKSNLLFNRYNIIVYVNGEEQARIRHGRTETISINLSKGTHRLRVVRADDMQSGFTTLFRVRSDGEHRTFVCKATSDGIRIEGGFPLWGIVVLIIAFVISVVGVVLSVFVSKMHKARKQIYAMIIRNDETSFDQIASTMQCDYDTIEKTLRKMLDGKNSDRDFPLLKNAYIDVERKKIVLSFGGNQPEWRCPFCGSSNSEDENKCLNCGAPAN
jgi:hypothetical protein